MYRPLYKKNQLLYGNGDVLVVTGWSPAKVVSRHLDESEYAAIGNLYSPSRGIDFLICNLLYNAHINYVVLLESTKEDKNSMSVVAAENALKGNISDAGNKWGIKNDENKVVGYLSKEIPYDKIQLLAKKVKSVVCYDIDKLKELVQSANIAVDYYPNIIRKPETIKLKEQPSNILPGDKVSGVIRDTKIKDAWIKVLKYIRKTGILRPTGYDGKWQETYNLSVVINPTHRDVEYEPWLPVDNEFIKDYVPQIINDAPYKEGVKYTYGQRIRSYFGYDQIEQIIKKLSIEPDAASAVIDLWDPADHDKGGSPCLNHIWIRITEDTLNMNALFRSNDMFGAWVANAIGLWYLQLHILDELNSRNDWNLQLGYFSTNSLSAHIYDDCFESADGLISKHTKVNTDFYDSVGDFVIQWENEEIKVERVDPDTKELVKIYKGKSHKKLISEIINDCYWLDSSHIAYLSVELYRCSKEKNGYTQT